MALPATLAEVGYYLLWAIGLILLLILILSASALLLTRIDFYAKSKFSNDVFLNKMRLLINYLFLKYSAFETDDFEDDEKVKQMTSQEESKTVEKTACYVTKNGEEIKIKTTQSQKHWDVYDIVIETSDFSKEADETSLSADETLLSADETNEPPSSACETNESSTPISETDEQITCETSVSENTDAVDEKTESKDTKSEENKSFQNDMDDLSGSFDEIKKYVDLSNPKQFVFDSLTAASKISASGSRLIGALLLRTNIKKLSVHLDYGLSDPADTAVSYGVIQSFVSGIYAYLDDAAQRSRSSRKRRRCKELASQIQNNVFITPELMEKKIDLESEVSVSFWIVRFYIPLLRFLFSRNTRWVLRRYVWVYYVKHYLKNKMRKKNKKSEAAA